MILEYLTCATFHTKSSKYIISFKPRIKAYQLGSPETFVERINKRKEEELGGGGEGMKGGRHKNRTLALSDSIYP